MLLVARNIVKNTFWLVLAELINAGLLFLLTICIARYLGVVNYGKFSFVFAFVFLFQFIFNFGFPTLTVKKIAKDKSLAPKYLSNISFLKIILAPFIFGLIFIIAQFLGKPAEIRLLIYLATLYVIFYSFEDFFWSFFRAFERMELEALTKIVHIIVLFFLSIYVIWQDLGIRFLVYSYILAALVGLIIALFLLRKKFVDFWENVDLSFCQEILKRAWPFALFVIFAGIYYYLDTVILSMLRTDQEVGWYNAAYKIVLFLIGLVGLYVVVLAPVVARYYKESLIALQRLINGSVRWLAIGVIPLGVGGTLLAKPIMRLFYGPFFDGGVIAFQILIWSMVILSISLIYGHAALLCDREKKYTFALASGLGINAILNLIFIPFWGLIGAAIATVIAQSVILIYVYHLFGKITKAEFFGKYTIKPLIASAIMALFLSCFINWHAIFLIILGGIIYLFSVYLIGGITRKDLIFFKQLIKSLLAKKRSNE